MLTRLFAARGFLSFGTILLLTAVAVVAYQLRPAPQMRTYCAEMPDAIGLFDGSDVTVMGVPVGRVTRIESHGVTARVEFELPASRTLPVDVGATTLSDTLIADRKLAIVGTESGGAGWDSAACITKTLTPKSMSQTFAALTELADELNGLGNPDSINRGIAGLNTMSTGTGEEINTILHRLGSALDSPDAAIGHIGALIDALGSLARSGAAHWPEIQDMLTRLAGALDDVNNIAVPPVLRIVDELVEIMPALNDVTVRIGGPLLRKLEAVENLPQLLAAGVAGLRDLLTMAPAIGSAFTGAIDPVTRTASVAYAPPRVAIPAQDAGQVCAVVNTIAPGRCLDAAGGLVDIQLAQLILGSVGAR